MGSKLLAFTLLALFPFQGLAATNLFFLQAPQGEVAPDSMVRLTVAISPAGTKAPDSCRIFRSGKPMGDTLAGHTTQIAATQSLSSDSLSRMFTFKPADLGANGLPQLGLGYHYLVASCQEDKFVSAEIPLWVTSRQAASFQTPKSEEPSASPNISWVPVPGVPAYHLMLSDQPLIIDPTNGSISGASVIWQTIITGTSIAYGAPDPSGNFSKLSAPPLSPNVPYNLIILNNYDGRSALATSAKAQGLKLFTIKSQGIALSKPKNIEPYVDKILSIPKDSLVRFKWTASKAGNIAANTYKLYVFSRETQDAGEILIPIFKTEVTDTFAVLDAKRTLLSQRYIWKVFAMNETGVGIVGDTSSFRYRSDVQTLNLQIRTTGSKGDTLALSDVRIEVVPLDGNADALPLFSPVTGNIERVLGVGSYRLTFSKTGFLSQTRTMTLDLQGPLSVEVVLLSASNRITGHVVDGNGSNLANVTVVAAGDGKTLTEYSDAGGNFLLGVSSGTFSISFSKADYQPPSDTTLVLADGKPADLGKITLTRPSGSLTGNVSTDKGLPLAGCQILIKAVDGSLLRSLLSDDKGSFSAFLSPGTYGVSVAHTGFTADAKTVKITEAVNIDFQLATGASVVKGRINIVTLQTATFPQTSPLPGAIVELVPKSPGTTIQKTESDLRGEYSFSADTGNYTLRVSRLDRARTDSVGLRVAKAHSTLTLDLALQGLASIQGILTFSPDTVLSPASASISLLKLPGLDLVRTATPQAAPISGGTGNMSYTLDGIPDGNYRVTCGLPGFGLDLEPEVTIKDAVWKKDLDLPLSKSNKSITFKMLAADKDVPGNVRLLTPRTMELASGTKLTSTSSGTYKVDASPDDAALIPLSQFTFRLTAASPADTTMTLTFPFSHKASPLTLNKQEAEFILDSAARPDSMLIVYGYGAPRDTFHVPASQLDGAPGPKKIHFRPGAQGGWLTYYFVIYSGALTYSNQDAAHRFRALVAPSHELAVLRVPVGDSLRLPSNSRCEILLHAYDASGNRLDSAVDARGTITWSSNAGLPAQLGKKSRRTLAIQTRAPSAALGKRSATIVWDTLRVAVTLDSVEQTLSIPTKVVSTVINKIVVSTTLGEVTEIPTPDSFDIFVSGFDTTTTPPTPMVPNSELTMIPFEAGTLKEMRVALDRSFIGPLRILAKHVNTDGSETSAELGPHEDLLKRGLNVGQILRPGDTARLLFHDPRFELRIPDSAFVADDQVTLRMYKRTVAKTFANGLTYAIAGNLYEISNPSGVAFSKPPRLSLGIPSEVRSRKNQFRRFDAFNLDWKQMRDSVTSENNSFNTSALSAELRDLDGSYYGLLTESQGLTAGEVEIIPNPFSPLVLAARDGNTQYGTRIRLHPESNRSAEVTISIKIYNMDSELIRHLVEHKTVPKAAIDFYWDGKADGGRWARNGRYLVKISLTSTGTAQVRHLAKQVVLFQ